MSADRPDPTAAHQSRGRRHRGWWTAAAAAVVIAGAVPVTVSARQVSPAPGAAPESRQTFSIVLPASGPLHDAWQAFNAGDLDRADALLDAAGRTEPKNPLVHLARGLVAQQRGQSEAAVDALTRALDLSPRLTPASLVLGELLYERADLAGAIRTYEAALAAAPGERRLAARLDRWRQEAALHATFLQTHGSHFTVLVEGPAEEAVAQRAIDLLEAAYDRINPTLLTYPTEPITVIFYTRDQFRDITRSPQWSGGVFDGRIRVPLRGAVNDPRELERVLTHEYVHALVHSVAPRSVPTWLNEGLAGYFETGGLARARTAVRGEARRLSLATLAGSFASLQAGEVDLAYAQSVLAVHAMIDRVNVLIVMALVTDVSGGIDFNDAFVQRFGIAFADFEREYLATQAPAR
jgi:tetratricopeptide (TPR) repeat protein